MTRRNFFSACAAAVGAMLMPAAKALGADEPVLIFGSDSSLWYVWRGRVLAIRNPMLDPQLWRMSKVGDPSDWGIDYFVSKVKADA